MKTNMYLQVKRSRAFTLLEMTVVLLIIGLLLLLVIPNVSKIRDSANARQTIAMVKMVQTQVDLYLTENGSKAFTIADLVRENYLTSEQQKQANNAKIVIDDNNHVTGPTK